MADSTRSKKKKEEEAAKEEGLDISNILHGKRNTQPPDRLGAPPGVAKDRLGNNVFLPGSSAVSTTRIDVSGDSMKDIRAYNQRTGGAASSGSGMTLHHHADYDSTTGSSTASLVPTAIHKQFGHIGSSAKARSQQHGGNPDQQAKFGTTDK